jgi:drug/metabolite transporter (DMT)-like permease
MAWNVRTGVYLILLVSMILWGLSFIWTSIVFKYYHPITTIFLRLVLSSSMLFLVIRLAGKIPRIRKEDYRLFLISSLLNPFFYFLGENFGLKYSTPSISAVVIATIPLFSAILAHFTLRERLSFYTVTGILLSLLGIATMLVNRDLSLNASPRGILFLFFAVFSAVGYSVMLKKLSMRYSPLMIIATQNLLGIFYFLPLFVIFEFNHFITVSITSELIISLLSLSLFASSAAFVLFTIGVREIGVTRANVFSNTIPVFTAVFSFFILSEPFNINKIAGIVIVIFGVFLSQFEKIRKPFNR